MRVVCNRTARIRHTDQEEFATVRDVSAEGVGLRLEKPLPPETLVVVEALGGDVKALAAMVMRVAPTARLGRDRPLARERLRGREHGPRRESRGETVCSRGQQKFGPLAFAAHLLTRHLGDTGPVLIRAPFGFRVARVGLSPNGASLRGRAYNEGVRRPARAGENRTIAP